MLAVRPRCDLGPAAAIKCPAALRCASMIRSMLSSANYKSECQLAPLALDEETRGQRTRKSQSSKLPHSLVLPAKIILAGTDGICSTQAGRRVCAAA